MSYEKLIDLLSDRIVKQAEEDVPPISYDRTTRSPYVNAHPEDAHYDEASGLYVGNDGTEYDEDGYPVPVWDIISPKMGQRYRVADNLGLTGALGALGGGIAGGMAGAHLGVRGGSAVMDRMFDAARRTPSIGKKLGLGAIGGFANAGLVTGGVVGGLAAGATPGVLLARHASKRLQELNSELTPEQIEELRRREVISKQAGYDAYESMLEKEAFLGAAAGAVKAVVPKAVGGLKNIGGLAKAQGDLMKTKMTAPKVQKTMQDKGIMGDFAGSAIANAKGNRDAAFAAAKPALRNVGLLGGGMVAGGMMGGMDQNKVAGTEAYYSFMEKVAKITREDKARFNNIKALGADFDPAPVKPVKKVSVTQPLKKIKPAVTDAVGKMPKAPKKGALGALGLGAALGTGAVLGAGKLMNRQDTTFKQAAEAYMDGLIQKQAALETMAEARLIAEASETAVNSYGYSMFA
jgi:hypothetical protein